MNFIKPLIISILLVNISVAEELIKPLSPSFLGSYEIHFSNTVSDGDEKALTAELIQEGGHRRVLPMRCNPEGGEPSLSSSYSLELPDGPDALVITCSYELDHSGLGLKGTQYISYVFKEVSGSIERMKTLEQLISGYEGEAEEGERQYYFYPTSELAKQKLKDGETDSPKLIHQIILTRLANRDYEAIRSYTSNKKNMKTIRKPPTAKRDISVYNDIGYALAEANELDLALYVLRNVEEISPERTVLMLNLADVLWEKGLQEEAKPYYQQYYSKMEDIGKKRLVPMRVMTRLPR
jgi:tetratricopeptide (TPR) repeat protein|tara:strand:- start:4227 stop:5111 length:885 start_codon:yes stop_codon:yes gene_type:complete